MTDPINTGWATPEGTPPGTPEPARIPEPVPSAPVPTPVPVPAASPGKKKSGALTNVLLIVAAFVAIGGVAFAAGRATAPAAAATSFRNGGQGFPGGSFDPGAAGNGQGGAGFGRGGSITMSGTVASVNGSTMTMTTANGQTVTVDLSGATYHAQAPATASDVTSGASVQVQVQGFGGGFRPGSSAAPNASGAPAAAGAGATLPATDVTIIPKS